MQKRSTPTKLSWTDYHQSTRRIVASYVPNHSNYRIHDHEFIEIAFIKSGKSLHQSIIGDTLLKPGDAFLMRPGAWHGYAQAKNLCIYNCCFDATLLGNELAWMAGDPSLGHYLWGLPLSPKQHGMVAVHLRSADSERCCNLLDSLVATGDKDYQSHHGDHVGLLTQILSLLARNAPQPEPNKRSTPHRAVTTALKLIDDSLTDNWTLARLSELVQVEGTYFVRLFRTAIGLPPMAYILRRRLELATQMLRRPDLSISEAGAMAGWMDGNYFSRSFRQHFGMTPSEYRARFQERPISG